MTVTKNAIRTKLLAEDTVEVLIPFPKENDPPATTCRSQVFEIGGYYWDLLWYYNRKDSHQVRSIAGYLEFPLFANPEAETRRVSGNLYLVNKDSCRTICRAVDEAANFNKPGSAWGAASFLTYSALCADPGFNFDGAMKFQMTFQVVREAHALNACLCLQGSPGAGDILSRAQERNGHPLFMDIFIARDQDIANFVAVESDLDLIDFKKISSMRVKKFDTFGQFKEVVAKNIHVPADRQAWFTWQNIPRKGYRPATYLDKLDDGKPMCKIEKLGSPTWANKVNLLLLIADTPMTSVRSYVYQSEVALIFWKRYYRQEKRVEYAGYTVVPADQDLGVAFDLLLQKNGLELDGDADITICEEAKADKTINAMSLDCKKSCRKQGVKTGTVLIFADFETKIRRIKNMMKLKASDKSARNFLSSAKSKEDWKNRKGLRLKWPLGTPEHHFKMKDLRSDLQNQRKKTTYFLTPED